MCASSELQFGGLREGGGKREAGSTVAESLVVLLSGGYPPDSATRRRRAARSFPRRQEEEKWHPQERKRASFVSDSDTIADAGGKRRRVDSPPFPLMDPSRMHRRVDRLLGKEG